MYSKPLILTVANHEGPWLHCDQIEYFTRDETYMLTKYTNQHWSSTTYIHTANITAHQFIIL